MSLIVERIEVPLQTRFSSSSVNPWPRMRCAYDASLASVLEVVGVILVVAV